MEREVLIVGSGGVWAKGSTLDEAYTQGSSHGGFGKRISVVVAPKSADVRVDSFGALLWIGAEAVHVHVCPRGEERTWANRRTAALRAAVDAALTAEE